LRLARSANPAYPGACPPWILLCDGGRHTEGVSGMTITQLFAADVADHRFWIALAIAILAGLVRGFSGFGSAQIYIPLIAAVYAPRVAAVTLLLFDTFGSAPFTVRAFALSTWREVAPLYLAAAAAA